MTDSPEHDDDQVDGADDQTGQPARMRWYNILFYGLGAIFMGATLAGIPAAPAAAGLGNAGGGIVFLVLLVPLSVLFFWVMRDGYRYLRSPEFAALNPEFAAMLNRRRWSFWETMRYYNSGEKPRWSEQPLIDGRAPL